MTESELERLRDQHPVLADVVAIDRMLNEQRDTGVISLAAWRLRREIVRAAEATWGHQLRGDGNRHA